MSWITDLKNQVQEFDKELKSVSIQGQNEYLRLSPMVLGLLHALGQEWYGKFFSFNKYKIETLPDILYWGIKRRGKGFELLPQQLHIKLRVLENKVYFAIDALYSGSPSISSNTADTEEESLKQAIVDLVSRT